MVGCGIFVIIVQHCRCAWWESFASSNNHKDFVSHITFQETSIYHLGKRKIIFKSAFERVYVSSRRVSYMILCSTWPWSLLQELQKKTTNRCFSSNLNPPSISLPSMQHMNPKNWCQICTLLLIEHIKTSVYILSKKKHRKLEDVLEIKKHHLETILAFQC